MYHHGADIGARRLERACRECRALTMHRVHKRNKLLMRAGMVLPCRARKEHKELTARSQELRRMGDMADALIVCPWGIHEYPVKHPPGRDEQEILVFRREALRREILHACQIRLVAVHMTRKHMESSLQGDGTHASLWF